MTQARPMVDPAECRRRARVCRERAQRSNINSTELMEAAETWEDLAHHAEQTAAQVANGNQRG